MNIVDLEYAKLLKDNKNHIIGERASGSPGFVCMEVLSENRYSPLSDTFALGAMLVFQLDIFCKGIPYHEGVDYFTAAGKKLLISFDPMKWFDDNVKHAVDPELKAILKRMLAPDYQKREGANEMIIALCNKLESDPALEEKYKQEMRLIRAATQLKNNNTTTPVQIPSTPLLTFSDISQIDEIITATPTSNTSQTTGVKRKHRN